MITLGLDPSLTGFGWCVHDSSAQGPSRVLARGRIATSAKEVVFVKRYMHLRSCVDKILTDHEVEAVGVESPTFGETWSEGAYGLFLFVNEAVLKHRKDIVFFDPGTVKFLTKEDPKARRGKMFKSDMISAAKSDTDTHKAKWSHDEADAYLVARFAARFWGLFKKDLAEEDLTPSERQSFTRIHTFKRGKNAGETRLIGALFKENKRFYRYSLLP